MEPPVAVVTPTSSLRNWPCPSKKTTFAPPLWSELMFAIIGLPLYWLGDLLP